MHYRTGQTVHLNGRCYGVADIERGSVLVLETHTGERFRARGDQLPRQPRRRTRGDPKR